MVYIRRILHWLRKKAAALDSKVGKLETQAHLKGRWSPSTVLSVSCILVAIPLPGTGAWTGALVAAFLDMPLKKALPTIFLGVVIAGLHRIGHHPYGVNLFSAIMG